MAAPSGTIVIIDDEATVRATARAILQRAGFAVEVAEGGRVALALIEQLGAAVAVVVLDWTLPDVSGSTMLAEVQRVAPHVRIIVSTGFGRADVRLTPAEATRVRFLEKPYTATALVSAVRTSLDQGPCSETLAGS